MFERFTEQARRVLFFARYEASQLGSRSIEPEHLLLGLLREEQRPTGRMLVGLPPDRARSEIVGETVIRERVSTSVEMPFSAETSRALQCADEESRDLQHSYIGTEHLLLGILRQTGSRAAGLLARHGVTLMATRTRITELLNEAGHAEGRPITSRGSISFDLACPPERQIHNTVTMLQHIVACLELSAVKGDGDEAARARVARLLEGLKSVIASMDAQSG